LAAERASGEFLVFINQDAEPGDEHWLDGLVQPMLDDPGVVATQGEARERENFRRFFWGTGGPRFYFTSESEGWIRRFHGIGFSTVNCAIRRSAWERNRFGDMAMLEDKGFQRRVHITGREIVMTSAWVLHSHDYDLAQLRKRCRDEGMGWRLVGERYPAARALRDTFVWTNYRELLRGLRAGEVRQMSELVFPLLRPLWLYLGNRFG